MKRLLFLLLFVTNIVSWQASIKCVVTILVLLQLAIKRAGFEFAGIVSVVP